MTHPGGVVAEDRRLRCRCQWQSPECVLRATGEDMLCDVCRRSCNGVAWTSEGEPLGHIAGPRIRFDFPLPLGPGAIIRGEP